jgi:hypothetical protein
MLGVLWLASIKAEDRPSNPACNPQVPSENSGQPAPTSDWLSDITARLPRWLNLGGQYRGRFEGQTGREFTSGNNDFYYLSQFRLDLKIRIFSGLRLVLEGQDSRAPGFDFRPRPASFQNSFDLRQGYLQLHYGDQREVGVQLGRQELSFGEERLIGAGNWSNTSRSFDAARLYVSTPSGRLDVLAADLVRTRDSSFDTPQLRGNNLYGAYASLKTPLRQTTIEPFLFYRTIPQVRNESGKSGPAGFYTFGARLVGELPQALDYNIEIAGERGTYAAEPFRAWAGHWSLGYTMHNLVSSPRLVLEYNYASGDDSPHDGIHETFDQLFPTNHSKYGTADVIGWRNMHNLRAGVEQSIRPALKISYDYHSHWLATAADTLYSDNGTPLVTASAGVSARHVGQEFDVVLSYQISQRYRFGFGYGYLWAGPFLRQATLHSNVSYPYTFLTYSF